MASKAMTRRDFLKTAGITLGAATLTCLGLTLAGARQPAVTFSEETIGGTNMTDKILVAYASRAGSTSGVAGMIGKTLAESGVEVDVRLMKDVKELESYRAVVAGSAIRGAKWLPEALEFMQANRAKLLGKRVAVFLVCATLAFPNSGQDQYRQFVAGFLKPVREIVKPVSEGLFAGALDYSKVALIPEGIQLRILSAASKTPPGDYRDWNAIRNWANSLVPLFRL